MVCERMSEPLKEKVQKALDEIRPQIQADGGDIKLVGFENGVVKVRLQGHCIGCPMSALTLKQGVEAHLKNRVPEVLKVESVQ
jgi:Fe-S cluster biogenesis protein NfuA